ncbi:MAG: hypothetical protein J7495_13305 [Sphingomonas sp.]|nr:hypothetical protein [Sphingomonas sp.]
MQILLDGWPGGGPPHQRLDRLLRALASGEGAGLGRDTLGMRNQRLLRLHAELGGGALEAVAKCPACGTDNEFALPGDALLALPLPASDAAATIGAARFRLPRMDDLLSDDPRPLAVRCCDGRRAPSAASIVQAGEALDALDPAANPVFDLACSTCGGAYRAAVDIAGFVAAALDRVATRLLHDIDTIAAAYGWSEQAIAALPADRRRRYVEMIAARGTR